MKHPIRWVPRALIAFAALCLTALTGAASAWAHVHVDADSTVRGSSSTLSFRVPNESESGSPTTQLTVQLPNVASARTQVLPGWTAKLDRDPAAGTVRAVTWQATPGAAGIPADQFEVFNLRITLPDTEDAVFPATQTYADGTVVQWDQTVAPGAPEPERPAPLLTLTTGDGAHADHHAPVAATSTEPAPQAAPAAPPARGDNVARALGGAALLVAALAVAAALVRRAR